jgi:hypothetical protein
MNTNLYDIQAQGFRREEIQDVQICIGCGFDVSSGQHGGIRPYLCDVPFDVMIANLEDRIGKAGLLSKMSTEDILMKYSRAYAVELESGTVDYEMPNKLEELDAKLGMNIFPILRS